MTKLAFLGFGEFGHYVKETIRDVRPLPEADIAYFDDPLHRRGAANAFPFAEHVADQFAGHEFYVCLGYKHLALRQRLVTALVAAGRHVPSFVHPSSYAHPSVTFGAGVWVYPGCSIDRGTRVGQASVLSNVDVIPHDCTIGQACWLGASVTLCGKVTIGDRTFVGSGTTVANDLVIGSDVIVGLATSVVRNITDGVSVIGNPMRILERTIRLV